MKMSNKNNIFLLLELTLLIFLSDIRIVYLTDINTDTLTSIIRYSMSDLQSSYATLTVTPNGNLICSASYYLTSTIKYYYGIKSMEGLYFFKMEKKQNL